MWYCHSIRQSNRQSRLLCQSYSHFLCLASPVAADQNLLSWNITLVHYSCQFVFVWADAKGSQAEINKMFKSIIGFLPGKSTVVRFSQGQHKNKAPCDSGRYCFNTDTISFKWRNLSWFLSWLPRFFHTNQVAQIIWQSMWGLTHTTYLSFS